MSDAKSRAATRAGWPIRVQRLEERTSDDLSQTTTAEQRVAMMWQLAREAWRLAGKSLPQYARHEAPGRVLRPGE
ncbi:MAG: hypothetical protein KC503_14120 [Myxococcales bacterium]|nr:hypothetical protein [Myxococcales bacterium]